MQGMWFKRYHTLFRSYLPKNFLKIKNTKVSNFFASDFSQETKSANSTDITKAKIPTSLCTSVCGDIKYGRSCGKTLLAKITDPKHPGKVLDAYVILDDQSNTSFADSTVFDFFNAEPNLFGYSLTTLGSKTLNIGRRITGLKIRGALENRTYDLPSLFEIVEMPDTKDEVATAEIVCQHKHLEHLASRFPSFQQDTPVLLLLGRDSCTVMKPLDYINTKETYAHHTTLGCAVIGSVCLGRNRQQRTLQTSTKCHPHFHAKPQFSHVLDFPDIFVKQ